MEYSIIEAVEMARRMNAAASVEDWRLNRKRDKGEGAWPPLSPPDIQPF